MFDSIEPPCPRVLLIVRIERASGSAWAMATKLYCPPTPLMTCPFSSPSETMPPVSVAFRPELIKRAFRGVIVPVQFIGETDRVHPDIAGVGAQLSQGIVKCA